MSATESSANSIFRDQSSSLRRVAWRSSCDDAILLAGDCKILRIFRQASRAVTPYRDSDELFFSLWVNIKGQIGQREAHGNVLLLVHDSAHLSWQ